MLDVYREKPDLINKKKINPFLKWAGGKRWLVSKHFNLFPSGYKRFIEPFLGSGAAFFALNPEKAILADINKELISTYQAVQCNWEKVYALLKKHHHLHCKNYYYSIRKSKPHSIYGIAARFIYLNRTCWNGLYRVNFNGEFNVPVGTKTNVILDNDDFEYISLLLRKVKLLSADFEKIINLATKGDLLFVDPPYTVKHNNNNFIKYNENLFSWNDQIRLRDSLVRAQKRGATVVATNAGHPSIKKLYRDEFDLTMLRRHSVIAASSEKRQECSEFLIRS